jgi:hypothetical protein
MKVMAAMGQSVAAPHVAVQHQKPDHVGQLCEDDRAGRVSAGKRKIRKVDRKRLGLRRA